MLACVLARSDETSERGERGKAVQVAAVQIEELVA
jgi:hypothetical protein